MAPSADPGTETTGGFAGKEGDNSSRQRRDRQTSGEQSARSGDEIAEPVIAREETKPSVSRPEQQSGDSETADDPEPLFGRHAANRPISPEVTDSPPTPVTAPVPDPEKLQDLHSETPEPIDVAAALKQPIRRFEQLRPAPFREVLLLIEEMAGVPIRYVPLESSQREAEGSAANVDPSADILDKQISLTLEETTVGAVLEALVAEVGLSYKIEADGIRLFHSSKPGDNKPDASSAGRTSDNGA